MEKKKGEVHLYNRDHPKDLNDETAVHAEDIDGRSIEEHHSVDDRIDLTVRKSQ